MSLHSSLTKSQIDLIFKVVDELIKHNYSVVKDEYGCTSILIRSVFCPETVSADFPGAFLVTSSNYKTVRIHDCTSKYYDIVVGIGNVSVIDDDGIEHFGNISEANLQESTYLKYRNRIEEITQEIVNNFASLDCPIVEYNDLDECLFMIGDIINKYYK